MRLGAPVYRWTTGEEWALQHVVKGYGAAYWPLPVDAPREREAEFCEALFEDVKRANALFVGELWTFAEPAAGRFIRCTALIFFS